MRDFEPTIDWHKLTREHDEAPERDDAEWLAALEAMDTDPQQRRRAVEADPLMMFRQPATETESVPAEIESMKAAVASLRRANAIEAAQPPRRRRVVRWPLAALLALAVSAALLTGSGTTGVEEAQGVLSAGSVTQPQPLPFASSPSPGIALAAFELPLVEDADPDSNLLMQIEDESLSLVVVMTKDQDV